MREHEEIERAREQGFQSGYRAAVKDIVEWMKDIGLEDSAECVSEQFEDKR